MNNKVKYIKPLLRVFIVIGIILFVCVVVLFVYLKRGQKEENVNYNIESTFFDSFIDNMSSMYAYEFYFTIEGEDAKLILPEWLYVLAEPRLTMDLNDNEKKLYFYGTIYSGGIDMTISHANPEGYYSEEFEVERSDKYVKVLESIHIKGNNNAIYITNCSYLSNSFIQGFFRCEEYESISDDTYVKLYQNKSGRDITADIVKLLSEMKNSSFIKCGVTKENYDAFTCQEEFTYAYDTDFSLTFPEGFTAYNNIYISGDVKEISFLGSCDTLKIEGFISEKKDYIIPYTEYDYWKVIDINELVDMILNYWEEHELLEEG